MGDSVEEKKQWIDNAGYEELLRRWRFAPIGDSFLSGEVGEYYMKKLNEKHDEVGNTEHTRVSKSIGW